MHRPIVKLVHIVVAACGLLVLQPAVAATVVFFDEQEPDTDQYMVRMIVTDRYLRIDDGTNESDYILFDRRDVKIHSVNHEDQTIIDIQRVPVSIPKPPSLTHTAEQIEMKKGPPIKGKEVKLFQLTSGDKRCGEVAAADGLLPDFVEALKQYRLTLAGEQAHMTEAMPKNLRNDCDMIENVFAPTAHLERGFPVFYRNYIGRVRSLKSLDESFEASEALFELPSGYRRVSLSKLRSGG